jgi:hypothetical protein
MRATLALMTDLTSSTIVIAAPRPAVMAVIGDFAAYPSWAGVQSAAVIGAAGADGRACTVRFEIDGGVVKERFTLCYHWDGDHQVRWEIAEPGKVLTAMSGGYRLADCDRGTTVTFELAVGVRIPLVGPVRRRLEKAVIDAALKGLETRVLEQQQTGG